MTSNNLLSLNFNFKAVPLALASRVESGNLIVDSPMPQLAYNPKCPDLPSLWQYAQKYWIGYQGSSPFSALAEQKYDGVRCLIVCQLNDKGSVVARAFSRVGNELKSVAHITNALQTAEVVRDYLNLPNGGPRLVFDCELIAEGREFAVISGLAHRQASDEETISLEAKCFAVFTASKSCSPIFTMRLDDRIYLVNRLNEELGEGIISNPNYRVVTSLAELESFGEELRASRFEGLILKSLRDQRYVPTKGSSRSRHWLKFKFKRSGTFRLVDVIEGEGKCEGMAGAIRIRDWDGNETLVGTGFTQAERLDLFLIDYKSKPVFVEIEYMTRVGDSLREASYKGLRLDLGTSPIIDRFETR